LYVFAALASFVYNDDRVFNKTESVLILVCQLPKCVVTRDAVSYPDSMAQYVLGHILARERHLTEHRTNQLMKLW